MMTRRTNMKAKSKVLLLCTAFVLLVSGILTMFTKGQPVANDDVQDTPTKQSKNLIVLIGDGMGPSQVTLSRLYAQQFEEKDQLFMDDYFVGTNSTKADASLDDKESGLVTDSAASGTAFATGHKTYNGAISVTNEPMAKPIASVLEAAKMDGKSTGLVSTARITHATPAVYAAHVRSRDNENAIASQYATADIDVLIGGGERHFVGDDQEAKFGETKREDGENVVKAFEEQGYTLAYNKEELQKAEGDKLLALLSDTHVPYVLDRDETIPSLKEQLEKAISILEQNEEGFVMMVEAGRIDHGGHANDIHSVVQELLEFDEAFEAAVNYAKESGDTSVIATADHETGGLTIGRDGVYEVNMDVFKNVTASSEEIGRLLDEASTDEDIKKIMKDYAKIDDLTDEELKRFKEEAEKEETIGGGGVFNEIIAKRSYVGWTGYGHTGVDVGVYGYGPAAELLRGFNDNTDFAKSGAEALGLDLETATKTLQEEAIYPLIKEREEQESLIGLEGLQEQYGFTVEKKEGAFEVAGDKVSFTINEKDEQVVVGKETYDVQLENDVVYVPITLLEQLTTASIQWDSLSERIILKK